MISESVTLNRIFEENDLRKALTEFCEAQVAIETASSAEYMGSDSPNPELARKHACFAKAFSEVMPRLREYAKKV